MLREYEGHKPRIHPSAYISNNAIVIGKVIIGAGASVWPACVIRGDVEEILIGENTNIQDGTIIHTNYDLPAIIGNGCTVGHRAVLHGCRIGNGCLIGMGAVILDGASVGDGCIIGAGSLVTENSVIPEGSLVLGVPGKVARQVTPEEKEKTAKNTREYLVFAGLHKSEEDKTKP
ncbi:MAG: gamma carbonic anhydrase family protein [Elusimicrobiota bacterium]